MGRSGTSAIGKILGSCQNTYYLYEPAIMKYMMDFDHEGPEELFMEDIRAVLFEDYLLPVVQGRYVNTNRADESCIFNYWAGQDLLSRRSVLNRRKDAIAYLKSNPPTVIIKTLESMFSLTGLEKLFPGACFVQAIRNGNEVIGSSKRRGWYTDEWLESLVDYSHGHRNCKIPWHIPERYWDEWVEWNQETRIACVWTEQNSVQSSDFVVRYERLEDDIQTVINNLGLKTTDLTVNHMDSLLKRTYDDHTNYIAEPLKTEFMNLMGVLGYAVRN